MPRKTFFSVARPDTSILPLSTKMELEKRLHLPLKNFI